MTIVYMNSHDCTFIECHVEHHIMNNDMDEYWSKSLCVAWLGHWNQDILLLTSGMLCIVGGKSGYVSTLHGKHACAVTTRLINKHTYRYIQTELATVTGLPLYSSMWGATGGVFGGFITPARYCWLLVKQWGCPKVSCLSLVDCITYTVLSLSHYMYMLGISVHVYYITITSPCVIITVARCSIIIVTLIVVLHSLLYIVIDGWLKKWTELYMCGYLLG